MVLAGTTGLLAQTVVMRALMVCMGECGILLVSVSFPPSPACSLHSKWPSKWPEGKVSRLCLSQTTTAFVAQHDTLLIKSFDVCMRMPTED